MIKSSPHPFQNLPHKKKDVRTSGMHFVLEIFRFRLRNAVIQTARNIFGRRKLTFNLLLTMHEHRASFFVWRKIAQNVYAQICRDGRPRPREARCEHVASASRKRGACSRRNPRCFSVRVILSAVEVCEVQRSKRANRKAKPLRDLRKSVAVLFT